MIFKFVDVLYVHDKYFVYFAEEIPRTNFGKSNFVIFKNFPETNENCGKFHFN